MMSKTRLGCSAVVLFALLIGMLIIVAERTERAEQEKRDHGWLDLESRLKGATKMSVMKPPYGPRGKIAIFNESRQHWTFGQSYQRLDGLEERFNGKAILPDEATTGLLVDFTRRQAETCLSSSGSQTVYDEDYTATVVDVRSLSIIGAFKWKGMLHSNCASDFDWFIACLIDPSKADRMWPSFCEENLKRLDSAPHHTLPPV
jgi:hypothetical protein